MLIGDSPFDYAAAEAGGFDCHLVATGSHSVEQLTRETGAAGIYPNLTALAQALFGLHTHSHSLT